MTAFISKNQEQTLSLGRDFASKLIGGEVVALYGNLGAGKTTFASGVINYFLKGKRVLSPTFVIVRHYYPENGNIKEIVHADVYRLENIKEIEDLGLSEYFGKPGILVLVEWADKMEKILPVRRIGIRFESYKKDTRRITIK